MYSLANANSPMLPSKKAREVKITVRYINIKGLMFLLKNYQTSYLLPNAYEPLHEP